MHSWLLLLLLLPLVVPPPASAQVLWHSWPSPVTSSRASHVQPRRLQHETPESPSVQGGSGGISSQQQHFIRFGSGGCNVASDEHLPAGARQLDANDHGPCSHLAEASVQDGFGAQLKRRIGVYAYARVHGLEYVHRPITGASSKHHTTEQQALQLDAYFNLGYGEVQEPPQETVVCYVSRCDGPGSFMDEHMGVYAALQPILVAKMAAARAHAKLEPLRFRPGALNVAVHIRRGDITRRAEKAIRASKTAEADRRVKRALWRYVPESYYVSVVRELAAALADDFPHTVFHIYSEGRKQDFPELLRLAGGAAGEGGAEADGDVGGNKDVGDKGQQDEVGHSGGEATRSRRRRMQRRLLPSNDGHRHGDRPTLEGAATAAELDPGEASLDDAHDDVDAHDGGAAPPVPLALDWHLDEDIRTTVAAFVQADLLVMGHSSLSYVAALYRSRGLTLYHPQWEPPLPTWMQYAGEGSVLHALRTSKRLVRLLQKSVQQRAVPPDASSSGAGPS